MDSDVAVVGDGDIVLLVGITVGDEHALAQPVGSCKGEQQWLLHHLPQSQVAHISQRGEGPAVVLEPKEQVSR